MIQCLLGIILAGVSIAHDTSGQELLDQRITLRVENRSVRKVLGEIEKQVKVRFAYRPVSVPAEHKISLDANNESLGILLDKLLDPLRLHYEVVGRQIVLSPREAENLALRSLSKIQVIPIDRTLTGTVTDKDGVGLPGVSVVLKNTSRGTTTNSEGNFTLEAPGNGPDVLVLSFVGYISQEVTMGSRTQVDVTLMEDTKALEEVIVVGYGTQKKRDLTGAISSISSKEIAETPAANLLQNAQGRLAGVDIVRANGNPGSEPVIRIRGNRSITAGNGPLYVIDGIPTDVSINDFNPNDIESMEVLKDASAVAIYGSRGANGVILITTKRGKAGKAVISYDGYFGIKEAQKDLNLMNGEQFARYSRAARNIDPTDASQDATFFDPLEIANLNNGTETDWLSLILRNGQQQQHQLSASGGSDKTTYYLSGAFFDEKGIMQKSDYQRYSFRVNLETKLTSRLRVGVSSTVSSDLQNIMANGPYSDALRFSPLIEPYDAEGNFLAYPSPREGLLTSPLLEYQPGQYTDERKKYRIFANIFAEYNLAEGLNYRLNYGPDFSSYRQGQYNGTLAGSANTAEINNRQIFAFTLENILTYKKNFGKHALDVVGLFSSQQNRTELSGARARNIPVETSLFYNLGSAQDILGISSSLSKWGLLSYMGRINYSFNNRYLLTLTGRADGSSRLSPANKWAFFPSVSAGWILSDETFLSGNKTLSFLKLRAGYGSVGNTAIDPYQTLGGLERSIYAYGNDPAFGYGLNIIPNPDLRWEISSTLNVGVDFGFLSDRITGSLEVYKTNTKDLLLERLIPITSGYGSVLQNIGATSNQGWELTLNGNVLPANSAFRWEAGLNVFSNKEKIVELFNDSDDVGNGWFIGQPIRVFYNYQQEGIWQTSQADEAAKVNQKPGDIRIADVNGRDADGNLTKQPDGQINADDRTVLGSTVPKWSGGLTNRFNFKGIDFSFLIYARQGQMIRSDFHNLGGNNWQGRYSAINFDYWTPTNPVNKIPKPSAASAPLYDDAVQFYDGSFVKIRNIVLGYTIPKTLSSKIGLSSLRVYATADNAFIFSPYKLVDPETSNGVVGGSSPMTSATYVFGLNLKF
ncbi:SusC/RagA family TonB-linked outer membrane protein [Persicitalea jodogahamensis]|uniref:SusC/RagA family TonB-linked outer membrane protein n=1 Tax=Persicitalea jodogahamensis TaxID=402147 RepID=A0A8J3DB47_9BACT|nr:SusC/RagA family TonB-linked outer membrane protein [Persicitalea jodogahamensis]